MERILDQMEEYDAGLDGWSLIGSEDEAETPPRASPVS
jgi:hypothetical protein